MSTHAWIKPAIAAAILSGAAYFGYLSMYAWPRADLQTKLNKQLADNTSYEAELKGRRAITQELKSFAAGTLAAKADQATARFRTALGAIASGCGIAEAAIVVNTSKPEDVTNPAGAKLKTRLRADLKKQIDFSVMRGTLDVKGSLGQVLRVAAAVQAQPWVHRVESFSIKPEGKERNRFALKLGVATLLMPTDLAPKDSGDPQIKLPGDTDGEQWAAVVAKNMFKEPAPVVAKKDPPSQPNRSAPPPPPPYDEWKLTGVIESRLGIEAFLVNTKSGQHMSLPAGATVADATFVSGEGERAVFEIGGQRFEVFNGQTLEQRRPATR